MIYDDVTRTYDIKEASLWRGSTAACAMRGMERKACAVTEKGEKCVHGDWEGEKCVQT